jgi:hypothetical protein
LLFIVYDCNVSPLQEVLAVACGITQGQACSWIHTLSEVLQRAVASRQQIPTRAPTDREAHLAERGETECGIEGTERTMQRPTDDEQQRRYDSGNKKAHTVNNTGVVTLKSRCVPDLSGTYEGKKHDKTICDDEQPTCPEGSTLDKDTGFQGDEPVGVTTQQPKNKPRGQDLSEEEQHRKTLISTGRIIVEHVMSGIKRCRIVNDVFRNTKETFVDLVMVIACGLHNVRTACRSKSTPAVA